MVRPCGIEVQLAGVKMDSGAEVGGILEAPSRAFQNGDQAVEAFPEAVGQGMGDGVHQSFEVTPQGFGHLFHQLKLFTFEDAGFLPVKELAAFGFSTDAAVVSSSLEKSGNSWVITPSLAPNTARAAAAENAAAPPPLQPNHPQALLPPHHHHPANDLPGPLVNQIKTQKKTEAHQPSFPKAFHHCAKVAGPAYLGRAIIFHG